MSEELRELRAAIWFEIAVILVFLQQYPVETTVASIESGYSSNHDTSLVP